MALTTAQQVRLKVQDQPLLADLTLQGDGTADSFLLTQRNLTTGSAFVPVGSTAWSATGATFNASGSVAFSGVISAASAFRLTYTYSTFSDDEIDHFITAGGGVNGAALEACEALMFDGLRRARWMAPDGSQYDDTAAMALLRTIHDNLKENTSEEAIAGGGVESWALEQENY